MNTVEPIVSIAVAITNCAFTGMLAACAVARIRRHNPHTTQPTTSVAPMIMFLVILVLSFAQLTVIFFAFPDGPLLRREAAGLSLMLLNIILAVSLIEWAR